MQKTASICGRLFCRKDDYQSVLLATVRRSMATWTDTVQAGDRVLLQANGKDPFMTKALHPDHHTTMPLGRIDHTSIIGRKTRDTVKTNRGADVRVYMPTLAEHVTMTPRIVTPIYPADANLLVSLLDIHVDANRNHDSDSPMEILEAGTGHGSLTLHLARAVHAANSHSDLVKSQENSTHEIDWAQDTDMTRDLARRRGPLDNGQSRLVQHLRRQAIIHTIDLNENHSQHAQRIVVNGFRQGLYSRDIDFHVGDVSEWIAQRMTSRGPANEEDRLPFLSHAILDMPDAQRHVETLASALKVNGGLLVFNPSITQIMSVIHLIKQRYLPLQLDRVLELGPYLTGGKEWDVRSVKPRGIIHVEENAGTTRPYQVEKLSTATRDDGETCLRNEEVRKAVAKASEGHEMVCRPKVGYLVQGGGFAAFFRKMKS